MKDVKRDPLKGTRPSPANAELVFRVELIDYQPAADPAAGPREQADKSQTQ